jgi:hypothetical protein
MFHRSRDIETRRARNSRPFFLAGALAMTASAIVGVLAAINTGEVMPIEQSMVIVSALLVMSIDCYRHGEIHWLVLNLSNSSLYLLALALA